jgi:hypothetical protein
MPGATNRARRQKIRIYTRPAVFRTPNAREGIKFTALVARRLEAARLMRAAGRKKAFVINSSGEAS